MGQQPLHRVAGFQPENTQVGEVFPGGTPADFSDAAEETLHREKIPPGEMTGQLERKSAVSAAQIDLERGAFCEQLAWRQAAKVVLRDEFSLFDRAWLAVHGRQSTVQSPATQSSIASALALDPLSAPPNSICNSPVALWT